MENRRINTILNPKNDLEKYHRHSIRLKDYDYSQAGAYFVTMRTRDGKCVFGNVVNGMIRVNKYGRMVEVEWRKTSKIRNNVKLDVFVVMPNHFHGIIIINNCSRGVLQYAPTKAKLQSPSQTTGAIVRGFKSATTKQINISRNAPGIPIWQRNYYEHIIRNGNELNRIRKYILDNPLQWQLDRENPDCIRDKIYDNKWYDLERLIYGKVKPTEQSRIN
jgi:putative transposase